jgi:ketosteroid isomerase-like protein
MQMRATPRCNPLDDIRYALCLIRGSLGGHAFANGARADEKQAVKDVLYAYEAAWSRPDARAIAGFYFRPGMRASRTGAKVRSTRAEQEKIFSPFPPSLVCYANSQWEQRDIQLLDANTAIARGVVVRYWRDHSVLRRQSVTYGLWHSDDGWKISMFATHASETALEFH